MTHIDILKQALEALEWDADYDTSVTLQKAAIVVLKKAIQEEALRNVQRIGQEIEQEPVGEAYLCDKCLTPFDGAWECPSCGHNTSTKESVYTRPQIKQDWSTQQAALESLREHMVRIKELEGQLEQMKADKPVAWMDSSGHPKHLRHIQNSEERRLYGELQPLYLHPQPKQEKGEPDWKALVLNHNADCESRCDMDKCGYKPYFEHSKRRCPNCPVHEMIDYD